MGFLAFVPGLRKSWEIVNQTNINRRWLTLGPIAAPSVPTETLGGG